MAGTDTDGGDRTPNTVLNGVIGGVVAVVLFLVPFSTAVGGAVAGYLEGGGYRSGAVVGLIAGVVVSFWYIVFVAILFLWLLDPGRVNVLVMLAVVAAVEVLYAFLPSVVGGVIGAYLHDSV